MLLGENLDPVVPSIAGSLHRLDEGRGIEVTLATQATMMDGVFPQRAYHLLIGVIEFDPADVLEWDFSNFFVVNATACEVPDIN